MHLKAVSMPSILIEAPWIYRIITQQYNCARYYWNIYFPCVSFLWATEMSRTVKQPIRAELNIIFMTLPNKPITDCFILGTNSRVVNGHVKLFVENFCPYLSHIHSILENNLKYCINAFYGTFKYWQSNWQYCVQNVNYSILTSCLLNC